MRRAPKTLALLEERLARGGRGAANAAYQLAVRVYDRGDTEAFSILRGTAELPGSPGSYSAAIRGLISLGRRADSVSHLLAGALLSDDREVVLTAIRAFWRNKYSNPPLDLLLELREHPDDEVQRYAMTVLASLSGDPGHLTHIRSGGRGTYGGAASFDDPVYSEATTILFRSR